VVVAFYIVVFYVTSLFSQNDDFSFLFFLFFGTQVYVFGRQALYHLSHTSCPFCFSCFGDRVSLFTQLGLGLDPSVLCPCCRWDGRSAPPCPPVFPIVMGSWGPANLIFPGLAWDCNPPDFTLQHS
jgi:hypothetical protein